MKKMKRAQFLLLGVLITACSNEPFDEVTTGGIDQTPESDIVEVAFPDQVGKVSAMYYAGEKLSLEEVDNQFVYEGDIIIPRKMLSASSERLVYEPGEVPVTKSVGRTGRRWPNNTVYYTIDGDLPKKFRVTDAIAHWEANTALRFVERTTQRNYVRFRKGSGCSSSVGMVGGRQNINLADGCSTGSTIHEIGHAVGLWHEQSRADRDNWITIQFQNIQSGREHNFQTYVQRGSDGDEYTSTLDFGSIMMYSSRAFSKNGQRTITKKDGSGYSTQRNGLSAGDLEGINKMYPGDGGGEVYENGNYYTIEGVRVYRYNDQWWYYDRSQSRWRRVELRGTSWYYIS